MNYHLNQNGQDVGIFPLEELRRRRAAGELTGAEPVWCEGMDQWQPLDSVLQSAGRQRPKFIAPPPLPAGHRRGLNPAVIALLVLGVAAMLTFAALVGLSSFRLGRAYRTARVVHGLSPGASGAQSAAMAAASRAVVTNANTRTEADVRKASREFSTRQFLEGYQQRGIRNPECDLLALQFLTNWIAGNHGETVDTNLPPLSVLSERLATDPACEDPLVLTLVALNSGTLAKESRRLDRAVKGFEDSKHLGYPKLLAIVSLTGKLPQGANRVPALDPQALQYLRAALTDGSIQPGNQEEIGEAFVRGWGRAFCDRNTAAVLSLVQDQGERFQWLAQVLEGANEINAAWRARGNGYANTVSDTGWKAFTGHLAAARKCLTQAWTLHPEWPLAPNLLMTVSLGDSGIAEMRQWFDRTTTAELDFPEAWGGMRWGLERRWYGDYDSMLAFGVTGLKTRRFDTDVPQQYMDCVREVEVEMNLAQGQHLFGREDIWPHIQEVYEGYIAEPSIGPRARDGWRSTYAGVAYLAGKYDVARNQLEALNWQPHARNLDNWQRDLSLLPQEVAARTGPASAQVNDAEHWRETGDVTGALQLYHGLAAETNLDLLTHSFVQERLASLGMEQHLQAGDWVDFLPTDTNFTGWQVDLGQFKLRPDGALEVSSNENGHLIYARARLGTEFEVRGQFEVASGTNRAGREAGIVMGIPHSDTRNWYALRMDPRNVSFSKQWSFGQVVTPLTLNRRANSFDFRLHHGLATASVNGSQVFTNLALPENGTVTTNEFMLGLGAFNDGYSSVIRYRQVQARRLAP